MSNDSRILLKKFQSQTSHGHEKSKQTIVKSSSHEFQNFHTKKFNKQ